MGGYSRDGTRRQPPPALVPYFWAPGWNSIQSVNKFQEEVGGYLEGGHGPGVRLLDGLDASGAGEGAPGYRGRPPERPPAGKEGRLRVVPLHHVFGGEELSARAPAVAERAPEPYLALHPEDAGALAEGDEAILELPDGTEHLPVRLGEDLPRGIAGLPVGLPGVAYHALPALGAVREAGKEAW